METEKRYDRQQRIAGWDQEKLRNATIAIVGAGELGRYTMLPLAAMGVGNIVLVSDEDAKKEFFVDMQMNGTRKSEILEDMLRIINPEINPIGIFSNLHNRAAQYYLEPCQLVIDTTNNIYSKANLVDFHRRTKTPVISCSAGKHNGKVVCSNGKDKRIDELMMPMLNQQEQGNLVSLELGAVVAEEAKKFLMGNDNIMPGIYNYNLESSDRFDYKTDLKIEDSDFDKNILIVGAGALGCFLGPGAIMNLKPGRIDIMDFDKIEEHNLNRQICYYDAVGRLKAERLRDALIKISRKTKVNVINEKFTRDTQFKEKYDLIFDAVDGFYAKALIHNYAKKNRTPLISGGTSFNAVNVFVYQPGVTSCFDCQSNLTERALKTEIIRRTSCLQAPDPSVIMTNQIAAAFMIDQARCVFKPEAYGKPVNGEIRYTSDLDRRGGINRLDKVCECHEKDLHSLELPSEDRVKIKEEKVDGKLKKRILLDGQVIGEEEL